MYCVGKGRRFQQEAKEGSNRGIEASDVSLLLGWLLSITWVAGISTDILM